MQLWRTVTASDQKLALMNHVLKFRKLYTTPNPDKSHSQPTPIVFCKSQLFMISYPHPSAILSEGVPSHKGQGPTDGISFNSQFPWRCDVVKIWAVVEPGPMTVVKSLWQKTQGNPEWVWGWKMLEEKHFTCPEAHSHMLDLDLRGRDRILCSGCPCGYQQYFEKRPSLVS